MRLLADPLANCAGDEEGLTLVQDVSARLQRQLGLKGQSDLGLGQQVDDLVGAHRAGRVVVPPHVPSKKKKWLLGLKHLLKTPHI